MDSSSTLRSMLLFLAMVLTTGASASIDLTQTRPGEVQGISSVDAFENDVLKSPQIWLVVFSSSTTDEVRLVPAIRTVCTCSRTHTHTRTRTHAHARGQVKARGVNRERCDAITAQLVNAAVELNSISVKVGLADIDDLGAIASEFNVRKRMLPVALLFKTRARDGEKLKAELFASPSEVRMARTTSSILRASSRPQCGVFLSDLSWHQI